MNATQAIVRSYETRQIVTIEHDPVQANVLQSQCVDHVDGNDVHEYWGEGWRVHMKHNDVPDAAL